MNSETAADEYRLRTDLSAVFRLAVMQNWHEGIFNHFSLMLGEGSNRFLINPRWVHFSRLSASKLIVVDADDISTIDRPDAPDPTAWAIHGRLHARLPDAKCVLHVHSENATALACLEDPEIKPIDQNTARFFRRHAIDLDFGGIADSDVEADRLVEALGDKNILIMRNHGILVVGRTVAEAYDTLYYLERSCKTLLLAYQTGQPLRTLSDAVAEQTARQWDDYLPAQFAHFQEMKALLDEREPDYAR